MKVDMATKIIHYCMTQNDNSTANSFLQSYIAESIRNNKKEENLIENCKNLLDEDEKTCLNCKYSGLIVREEPCKSCYDIYPPNKNWEPKS